MKRKDNNYRDKWVVTFTNLCQMYFPILINWTSPFPILGLLDGMFSLLFNFLKKLMQANSREPNQTPRFAASNLVLYCSPMYHKKMLTDMGYVFLFDVIFALCACVHKFSTL